MEAVLKSLDLSELVIAAFNENGVSGKCITLCPAAACVNMNNNLN